MTPSEVRVPLPFKTCHNGLHMYDRTLKHCPECLEATRKRHYEKNKYVQMARANAKKLADPEFHEAYKKRMREYAATHREEARARYREKRLSDPEGMKRRSRDYARAHSEYGIWKMMTVRCSNPKSKSWPDYGGRGIRVCPRWFGVGGFKNFLADMGPRPSLYHQLNRKDNDGNYNPDNCCWSERIEQCRNRRSSFLITFKGKTQCLQAWVEETGINQGTLYGRLKDLGWSIEDAMTTPPRKLAGRGVGLKPQCASRGYEKVLIVEN